MRVLVLLMAMLVPAAAHEWFDAFCCTGKDCKPVGCGEIATEKNGYSYVYKGNRLYLNGFRAKISQDGACYVCVGLAESAPFIRCIYLPYAIF